MYNSAHKDRYSSDGGPYAAKLCYLKTKKKRVVKQRRCYMVDYVNSIHFGHYYYGIDSITQAKQPHISVMELGAINAVDVTAERRTCACTGIRTWFACSYQFLGGRNRLSIVHFFV